MGLMSPLSTSFPTGIGGSATVPVPGRTLDELSRPQYFLTAELGFRLYHSFHAPFHDLFTQNHDQDAIYSPMNVYSKRHSMPAIATRRFILGMPCRNYLWG
jgi:hypothetical protein